MTELVDKINHFKLHSIFEKPDYKQNINELS